MAKRALPRCRPETKPLPSLEELERAFICDFSLGTLTWRERHGTDASKQFNAIFAGRVAGRADSGGHGQVTLGRQLFLIHRIIWKMAHGADPVEQIDHINGNRSDNRLCNLREASRNDNARNRKISCRNTSGFKGVSWHSKAKKWQAMIGVDGRNRRLGLHETPEQAHAAYLLAAERFHGEFARAV